MKQMTVQWGMRGWGGVRQGRAGNHKDGQTLRVTDCKCGVTNSCSLWLGGGAEREPSAGPLHFAGQHHTAYLLPRRSPRTSVSEDHGYGPGHVCVCVAFFTTMYRRFRCWATMIWDHISAIMTKDETMTWDRVNEIISQYGTINRDISARMSWDKTLTGITLVQEYLKK